MKKIAVLMGGLSEEREISLKTGEGIYKALLEKGYNAVKIDVDRKIIEKLNNEKPDVVFLALHGKYGEDGTIQGLLEIMNIPYTGSGVLASALGMNKIVTKKILSYEGIPTPKFMVLDRKDYLRNGMESATRKIIGKFRIPLVVKAVTQGSSIGVYIVNSEEQLAPAVENAFKYDNEILIEEFIKGKELTCGVLGNEDPIALPIIEITSVTGVYDYTTKYTAGMSDHIIPARIPDSSAEEVRGLALKTYQAIGCRGLARIDFLLDDEKPYVLEVNTMPGMTETSLYPDAAKAAGIDFPDLVDKLVKLALEK